MNRSVALCIAVLNRMSKALRTAGTSSIVAIATIMSSIPNAAANDDEILAVVNGHEVRRAYIYEQLEALPLGDQVEIRAQLERFVDSIVREETLFQFMLAGDFAQDPALREAIKTTVVNHLIKTRVTDKILVTDEDVLQFYKANASAIRDENVRASQILLKQRNECVALKATITSDAEFAAAARKRSLHRASADKDGDIGLYMNHNGPLGFETRFFEMQAGEMQVFESEDGCHLVRIVERVTPPMPPLENVAPRIRTLLGQQLRGDLLKALLAQASAKVQVKRPARTAD
ncbi:MAG: parvulin-like peptidyl-prolyl isomerase [Gammaproteobacteria bacterium]|jgi:parvulin-like peptidyl-prolyl isomerase